MIVIGKTFANTLLYYKDEAYKAYQQGDIYDTFSNVGCTLAAAFTIYKFITPLSVDVSGEIFDTSHFTIPDM